MEAYFDKYRKNVIGIDQTFVNPSGETQKIVYADWTASGRLYGPIETRLLKEIAPFVANTHTETNITGSGMTLAYSKAKQIIKKHVNANSNDIIICSNSGMTGVVNKFQRILGLKIHERYIDQVSISAEERPVVFITHMEHHSNQTTWIETIAEVVVIPENENGLVCLIQFADILEKYKDRKVKFAAVTSCSNVTGIFAPYHEIAELMHNIGGLCFVDFACSAPYVHINMHPKKPEQALDAIYFSPHKFLGGPGASGALIFNSDLYANAVPDNPGGGTVDWTNPWGEQKYIDDIETREDGGTPAFLQTIKAALCVKLKEEMGVDNMLKREKEIFDRVWNKLNSIDGLHVLADQVKERLCIFSFYIDNLHYNLGVKMLNDRFGIQVRGGCSCAGTYGHCLLHVTKQHSKRITDLINQGDLSEKPGWIRMSIHPIMNNEEIDYIISSIRELAENFSTWADNYHTNFSKGEIEFRSNKKEKFIENKVDDWFTMALS